MVWLRYDFFFADEWRVNFMWLKSSSSAATRCWVRCHFTCSYDVFLQSWFGTSLYSCATSNIVHRHYPPNFLPPLHSWPLWNQTFWMFASIHSCNISSHPLGIASSSDSQLELWLRELSVSHPDHVTTLGCFAFFFIVNQLTFILHASHRMWRMHWRQGMWCFSRALMWIKWSVFCFKCTAGWSNWCLILSQTDHEASITIM